MGKGEGFTGTIIGHLDNNKGGWKQVRQARRAEMVGRGGGKSRKLYVNNNKKSLRK